MPGIIDWFGLKRLGGAPATSKDERYESFEEISLRSSDDFWETNHITGLPKSGYAFSSSGVKVTREVALKFSAYLACIKVIAESISTLPIRLYEDTEQGMREAKGHYINNFFKRRPSEYQSWQRLINSIMADAAGTGNGYARIFRNGFGEPIRIQYLSQHECTPYHEKWSGHEKLYYHVMGEAVLPSDIIHITGFSTDGVKGISPIHLLAEEIGIGAQANSSLGKFYKNGFRSQIAFLIGAALNKETRKDFIESVKKQRHNNFLVLDGGSEAKALNISPKDAEVLASKEVSMKDVARVMRVPLHKIGLMEASTNNNIEQLTIDFVTDTLVPWITQIEQELTYKLIPYDTKYSVNLNLDFIMRGNTKMRSDYYRARFATGSISPNEIRFREGDLIDLENELMNQKFVQSGFVPLKDEFLAQKADNNLNTQQNSQTDES